VVAEAAAAASARAPPGLVTSSAFLPMVGAGFPGLGDVVAGVPVTARIEGDAACTGSALADTAFRGDLLWSPPCGPVGCFECFPTPGPVGTTLCMSARSPLWPISFSTNAPIPCSAGFVRSESLVICAWRTTALPCSAAGFVSSTAFPLFVDDGTWVACWWLVSFPEGVRDWGVSFCSGSQVSSSLSATTSNLPTSSCRLPRLSRLPLVGCRGVVTRVCP
jgi:hypothetical protein